MSSFSAWDYTILIVSLLISLLTGFYFRFSGGRQKTNEEYLLANRGMGIIPVSISLMASYLSAIALFGMAAEVYSTGFIYIITIIGFMLGVLTTSYIFLPIFFNLENTSTYEYLELRFGKTSRIIASLVFAFQQIFYNSIVLYTPSTVLEAVVGLDKNISILSIGIVCMIYCTIGGMKAVIWTDTFQTLLMIASVLIVIVSTIVESGGWEEMVRRFTDGGRINMNNWNPSILERHTIWTLLLGGTFFYMTLYGVTQTQVVRYKALPTIKKARVAMLINVILATSFISLTCLAGLGLYSYYYQCDPLLDGMIPSYNYIMPFYIAQVFSNTPGIQGLFAAGVLNASLSTISSTCNALAGLTVTDYLGPFFKPSPIWTKGAAFVFGVIITGLAFVAENFGQNVLTAALTITGILGGPLLGIFSLGILTTFANEYGAVVGILSGIAINVWSAYGVPRPSVQFLEMRTDGCLSNTSTVTTLIDQSQSEYFFLYRISYMYYSLMGFLLTFIIGSVVSLIISKKHPWETNGSEGPNEALYSPLIAPLVRKQSQHFRNKTVNSEKVGYREKSGL